MGYTSSPSPMYPSVPRSIGGLDREYGILGTNENWSAPPNRYNHLQQPHLPLNLPQHRISNSHHSHPSNVGNSIYASQSAYNDREGYILRNPPSSSPQTSNSFSSQPATPAAVANPSNNRSTLYWGDLEPWMDEEWAKRVCGMMNWDPVNVKVPHPQPDPASGQQANNPGYCFLTFPSRAHAEQVMNQVNPGTGGPITMPNSSRPFNITWAASLPTTPVTSAFPVAGAAIGGPQQHYPREYSIFVGDLAPETSNSDLVAVFRNPVLGLRNDREPKFIRPFLSCKSAKIMLDPVTGVSRGYGFVRFTDESDQQRALIEMHGLYCLSRPMRISPATAKFKTPPNAAGGDMTQSRGPSPTDVQDQAVTIAVPLPTGTLNTSVSVPNSVTPSSSTSSNSNAISPSTSGTSSLGGSNSAPSLSSSATANSISSALAGASPEELLSLPPHILSQFAQGGGRQHSDHMQGSQSQQMQGEGESENYSISEESWKHHVQARAILGNLMGPNGEQLTSTDPYNTTVFVGGLSPLIGEETLRSFFAPFGEIHYVKVPVGKHCGFVQFVRKADAERAIEQMQAFPIGGSRIRLSWGRSQYKAAQAAAQAAQSTALQAHIQPQIPAAAVPQMTADQALQLLQRLGLTGLLENQQNPGLQSSESHSSDLSSTSTFSGGYEQGNPRFTSGMMEPRQNRSQKDSNFSPFSPDPNMYEKVDLIPRNYAPGASFGGLHAHEPRIIDGGNISPSSSMPNGMHRFGSGYLAETRRREPISRPNSGTPTGLDKVYDPMADLNGTLASLDLDQSTWRTSRDDHYESFPQYRTAASPPKHSSASP